MTSYTHIIEGLVEEFTCDPEQVKRVVTEAAEKYRSEYYSLADVGEDDYDPRVIENFLDDVRREIVEDLKLSNLL